MEHELIQKTYQKPETQSRSRGKVINFTFKNSQTEKKMQNDLH